MSQLAVEFIKPTEAAINYIAENMRPLDAAEVMSASGHTPLESVRYSVDHSNFCSVICVNNTPCLIFGLAIESYLPREASPWMLGSVESLRYGKVILKVSPPVVHDMVDYGGKLHNYVHVNNGPSIRWLTWLGFTLDSPIKYGRNGELFHPFHLDNKENIRCVNRPL